jgi:hypothetical protein
MNLTQPWGEPTPPPKKFRSGGEEDNFRPGGDGGDE